MSECTQLYTELHRRKVLSLGQLNNGPQIVSGFLLNQYMCFPILCSKPLNCFKRVSLLHLHTPVKNYAELRNTAWVQWHECISYLQSERSSTLPPAAAAIELVMKFWLQEFCWWQLRHFQIIVWYNHSLKIHLLSLNSASGY